jgi:[ribosomal protein S5]-alanine N-acetyltransferase
MQPVNLVMTLVRLREFTPDDADSLYKVYSDPDTTRHLSFEPKSREEAVSIVAAAMKAASVVPRTEYMLAVEGVSAGEMIGVGRLALGEHQSGQIGFALRSDLWGLGMGKEIVRALQKLGFDYLDLHRIWGARSPVNFASARTMLGVGMIEEGTIRGHLFTRGAWRDSVVHSVLADEYLANHTADA